MIRRTIGWTYPDGPQQPRRPRSAGLRGRTGSHASTKPTPSWEVCLASARGLEVQSYGSTVLNIWPIQTREVRIRGGSLLLQSASTREGFHH